jgi:hypothetical protein
MIKVLAERQNELPSHGKHIIYKISIENAMFKVYMVKYFSLLNPLSSFI